ncbi:hypothetical protein GCM10010277_02490 [Streptomyces longisporoflavus]|nr:hypothetical protein GCM10010277_02490 [Streptomyces longisporoflavus]
MRAVSPITEARSRGRREARDDRVARSTDRAFHLALYASLDSHLLSEVLDAFRAAMARVREDLDDGHQRTRIDGIHSRLQPATK